MKTKHLISLGLLLLFAIVLSAQETTTTTKTSKFSYGPRFGLDVISTTGSLTSLTDQLADHYQAGLFLQYGEKLFVRPEAYYAHYTLSATTSQNYVKVPVMLGLRLIDLGLISVHIMGGPMYSMVLDPSGINFGTSTLNWQVGAGVYLLDFINLDLRYTLNDQAFDTQIQQATTNPTILNLTIGLKLK